MSDRHAVALAIAAMAGAWWSAAVPLIPAIALVAAALVVRKPWVLVVGVLLLSSSLGARAWAGLDPLEPAAFEGEAALVSDPVPVGEGMRVFVRAGGRRYEAWAYGRAARDLSDRLAGDRISVTGSIRPIQPLPDYQAARHVANRLNIDRVHHYRDGPFPFRMANWLRRTIARGAQTLDDDRLALFTGLSYGDDRHQSPVVSDDFRAAGLTHLLAVSGQNVAFVLILARPLIERFDYRGRWVLTLGAIGFFALVTRFEPSVLRASVMAAIAATATLLGREASSRRVLALAVALLVLVDPLLVHSVAFRLSVAASTGIILWAPRLAERLRGPRILADALAVTVSAQLAVAPLLIATFGGVPVASLPANLLAAPVAGPIMMWSLSAGLVAGLVGGPLAHAIHWPTDLGIGWIQAVAGWSASARLGELRTLHLIAVAIGAGGWWLARGRLLRAAAALGLTAALLVPAVALRIADPPFHTVLDSGVEVWRHDETVVVVLGPSRSTERLLEDLRRAGVGAVDLAVADRGTKSQRDQIRSLQERMHVGTVIAPPAHRIGGARTVRNGQQVLVGSLVVEVTSHDPRLAVVVTPLASQIVTGAV
ncbi:ComEC/Rec2 family competence protein [Candidatus Poriferisocius sp.]|uniref:ComEC/Rec2 family competence protein n=1 Tax=Candidatus Poriferisocius sp. TaxID=3101276 RepID=UPI003B014C46